MGSDDSNQIMELGSRKPVVRVTSGSVARSFINLIIFTLCCQLTSGFLQLFRLIIIALPLKVEYQLMIGASLLISLNLISRAKCSVTNLLLDHRD